jgi:hypothetical protein
VVLRAEHWRAATHSNRQGEPELFSISSGVAPGSARAVLRAVAVTLIACGVLTVCAWAKPLASSAATYTWTGSAPASEPNWSKSANWGGVAPPEEPLIRLVGEEGELYEKNLVFPKLSGCAFQTDACENPHNDRQGQFVHSMTFGCETYDLSGEQLTLTSALTASCAESAYIHFKLPMTVEHAQTWQLEGGVGENVTEFNSEGSIYSKAALHVNLKNNAFLYVYNDVETSAIEVEGFGTNLLPLSLLGGSLNANGKPVTLRNAGLYGTGTVGELLAVDGSMTLSSTLRVVGNATLERTKLSLETERGFTSGIDASGLVDLNGATLSFGGVERCPEPGEEFTLVKGSAVSGGFDVLTPAVSCGGEGKSVAIEIRYTGSSVIAVVPLPGPPPPLGPPVNTSPAVVAGIGSLRGNAPTYECRSGWSGSGSITTTATWLRDGSPVISQAASYPYIATSADAGQQLSCTVSASSAYGSASSSSAAVAVPGYWPPAVRLGQITTNEVKHACLLTTRQQGVRRCDEPRTCLEGEVVPGSVPVQYYRFVYYATTYHNLHTVQAPPLRPGPVEACVGEGQSPPDTSRPEYVAYEHWAYYLEAYDGSVAIKSPVETFLSGGAAIPPGWGPPSKPRVKIECPSSCAAIVRETVAGLPFIHFTTAQRGTEEGTLEVTRFVPASGQFEGAVNWDIYGKDMTFEGSLREGLAYLSFHSTVSPGTLGTHYFDFKLGGAIFYNGFPGGYSSGLEGPLEGGGKWVVCFSSTAGTNCPGAPNAETKAIAKNLSDGSGYIGVAAAILPGVDALDAGLAIFGVVTNAIAEDPPDPSYKQLERPRHLRAVVIRAGHGISRTAAKAATAVLNTLRKAAGYGQALVNAAQRLQGAMQAHQHQWMKRHLTAAITYAQSMASQCRALAQLLNTDRTLLSRSPLATFRLSAGQISRLTGYVRRHGLPARAVRELRELGLTPAMINNARKLTATTPHKSITPIHELLSPAFNESLMQLADHLEEYAETLATSAHR